MENHDLTIIEFTSFLNCLKLIIAYFQNRSMKKQYETNEQTKNKGTS